MQRCQFGIYEFELAENAQIHSRFIDMFMDLTSSTVQTHTSPERNAMQQQNIRST